MRFPSRLLWTAGALLLWWWLSVSGLFHPLVLPSPLEVLKQTGQDILSGELPLSLFFSIKMILLAFLPALILSFLMALLARLSERADRFWEFLSALAHPLPGIALLPLLILWTGLGAHIIVLIVFHSVVWPFYINLRSGFREVSSLWLDLGRNNQLSRRDTLLYILIPGAYPSILAGLKISWARAWRAVIAAEMLFGTIGSTGGLGWYIYNKRIYMDTPGLYSGILILMVLGILVEDLLFARLDNRKTRIWGTQR